MQTMSSDSRPGRRASRVEVGDEQPVGIGDPVGHRDDRRDGTDSAAGSASSSLAQRVFVAARRLARPAARIRETLARGSASAEAAARRRDPRRPAPPERLSTISSSNRAHLLRLAPQLIVEAQHLGDEAGPDRNGRSPGLASGVAAAACTIASRSNAVSRRGGLGQAPCKRVVELIARSDESRAARRAIPDASDALCVERLEQDIGGARVGARTTDGAGRWRLGHRRETSDHAAMTPAGRRRGPAASTRGDHRAVGAYAGRACNLRPARARSSISAPAAADEASHARAMSSTASAPRGGCWRRFRPAAARSPASAWASRSSSGGTRTDAAR